MNEGGIRGGVGGDEGQVKAWKKKKKREGSTKATRNKLMRGGGAERGGV